MRRMRCGLGLLVVVATVGLAGMTGMAFAQAAGGARKAEFWIGAIDPVVQKDKGVANPADYMELFGPSTGWPTVARRTSTLEISTQLVLRGTPEQHKALIDGLRMNHLKLAGQFGVEELEPAACMAPAEGQGDRRMRRGWPSVCMSWGCRLSI